MNRQEIADRLSELPEKYAQARKAAGAPIDAEKAQLQAACGEIGHIYRSTPYCSTPGLRQCGICDVFEPQASAAIGGTVAARAVATHA